MAYEKIATKGEINPKKYVNYKGKDLALFLVNGSIYCIDNTCTHVGGPLVEGEMNGVRITCPWHFAEFNVITGKALSGPARSDVKTYPVKIENDEVYIDI